MSSEIMSSGEHQLIAFHVHDGIATVMLDRPPLNVLNIPMLEELEGVLEKLAGDESVRVLILRGEGKLFSAGVDVGDHTTDKVGIMIPLVERVCRALVEFPVPTIACVHGHALGGGCELVLCCDLAVIAESARLGQPEIQLAAAAPFAANRFPQLIGYRAAADLLLTGRNLDAHEAMQLGLVNAIVPAEEVLPWAQSKAAELAGLSRVALMTTKRMLCLTYGGWAENWSELERLYLDDLMNTQDASEGLSAFMEKRKPRWKHR
jgi:cyclohexa-1,5-dienecarbonyl-CoA hydratase